MAAALLHAVWNALVKSAPDKFMTSSRVCLWCGVIAFVVAALTPMPAAAAYPFAVASAIIHVVYFWLVGRLYRTADLSVAYPLMRGLAPLIATAMRFAVHYQATAVYLGLRLGTDADKLAQATEYGQIWNEMMQMPCNQPELMVEMPLLELEPWQVVDVGFQVSAPLDKTWTCTEAGSEPCWACRACRSREAAFQQAAKPDPMRTLRKV